MKKGQAIGRIVTISIVVILIAVLIIAIFPAIKNVVSSLFGTIEENIP
jgi:Flp pilus assembly pilin Flp|tara:strand:+ start:302 stop:445 length:144 start_codon:yes stop_codon:yes gene_type:complete